jgi:hypothetical protein
MPRPSLHVAPLVGATYRRFCSAHRTNGEPCKRAPINGGAVCIMHGGKAPQVKAKAEDRIREMVDPALNRLLKLIDSEQDATALAAVKDILDRAGYKQPERQQISGPDGGPIQTEDMTVSDDDRAARVLAIIQRARGRVTGPAESAESDLASAPRTAN